METEQQTDKDAGLVDRPVDLAALAEDVKTHLTAVFIEDGFKFESKMHKHIDPLVVLVFDDKERLLLMLTVRDGYVRAKIISRTRSMNRVRVDVTLIALKRFLKAREIELTGVNVPWV